MNIINWDSLDRAIARELGIDIARLDNTFAGPPEQLTKKYERSKLASVAGMLSQYGVHLHARINHSSQNHAEFIVECGTIRKSCKEISSATSSKRTHNRPEPSAPESKKPRHSSVPSHFFKPNGGTSSTNPFTMAKSAYEQQQNMEFSNLLVEDNKKMKEKLEARKAMLGISAYEPRSDDEAKAEPVRLSEVEPASADEKESLEEFLRMGFSEKRTLQVLRQCNGDRFRTRSKLLEDLRDFQEKKLLDNIREQSEITARDDRLRNDKELQGQLSYTDVLTANVFKNSMFLDPQIGVPVLQEILLVEKDGAVDLTHAELRDACIKLLSLEKKCFEFYGVGSCAYILQLINNLQLMPDIDQDVLDSLTTEFEHVLTSMPEKQGHMPNLLVVALNSTSLQEAQKMCSSSCFLSGKTLPCTDDEVVANEDDEIHRHASSASSSSSAASTSHAQISDAVIDLT